ncbi:OmpA family protein [Portibacter marinus]|uniref:OmpA family protein n=1 Tax=Portibacter marinus TaxID=2898660 RepID=UPI001F35CF50|nr:OmpA family protein [Portibacter marinus]
MRYLKLLSLVFLIGSIMPSCVSKKKFMTLETELEETSNDLRAYQNRLQECNDKLAMTEKTVSEEQSEKAQLQVEVNSNEQLINSLNAQIADLRKQRDQQVTQLGDLTVLSKSANENIGQTIRQLEKKDEYIQLLNMAKNKADSLNLALAINLKSVLAQGIADEDVEVKVDKTVVFINLSDKMLYRSGSAEISDRAGEVLSKIAQIIKTKPDLEVMVEGYTDTNPINTACIKDNWDLSVMRATSVVRTLQSDYGVDPNKLIAAGRGEYNALADNATAEGRSMNRRTRIIILPKLNQFYDLLNPELAAK